MHIAKEDVNIVSRKQRYDRIAYRCVREDIWVTVETPVEEE